MHVFLASYITNSFTGSHHSLEECMSNYQLSQISIMILLMAQSEIISMKFLGFNKDI